MKYLKVWTSFRKVIQTLQDDEKGRLFDMMLAYAETGEEPQEFEGNERFLWYAAKQDIDMTAERAEKLRENASKGGLAKSKNKQALANDSKSYQELANVSNDEQELAEKKGKEKKGNIKEKKSNQDINIVPLKRHFEPPTVSDVEAYCDERGSYLIDPQQFVDYYQARGWILTNGKKMVDWKAAVRLWEKNERERQRKSQQSYDLPY